MTTKIQEEKFIKSLSKYKAKYLGKDKLDLDESSTRLMINYFLSSVLGYVELQDISTEHRISDKYADYVIELGRKKHFVVEVKAIKLDLSDKHFRQALEYAANEGIEWILLTNGRQFQLYRVIFKKPIDSKKVLDLDLLLNDAKKCKDLILITKKSVEQKEIEEYWKRFEVLEPGKLHRVFYRKEVVGLLRRLLKAKHCIKFSDDDLLESVTFYYCEQD